MNYGLVAMLALQILLAVGLTALGIVIFIKMVEISDIRGRIQNAWDLADEVKKRIEALELEKYDALRKRHDRLEEQLGDAQRSVLKVEELARSALAKASALKRWSRPEPAQEAQEGASVDPDLSALLESYAPAQGSAEPVKSTFGKKVR